MSRARVLLAVRFLSVQRRHWRVLHYFSAAVVLAKLVQELASSSPEVTATPDTTSTAEAAPTPTADRTPKMVALGELPTVEQLSVENLREGECIMYSVGAFKTKEGTIVSRPIVTVNGKLTTFGEEVCNGGKVEVGKEDDVRYFVIVWEQEPGCR